MVSNYGKVYDLYYHKRQNTPVIISNFDKGNKHNQYFNISFKMKNGKYKNFRLHRVIISCFYPNQGNIYNKLEINHKDGDGKNNYISYNDPNRGNIEWMSHRDNILHAYKTGLHQVGEDNVHTIITNEEAKKVIELLATDPNKYTYTSKEIATVYTGAYNETKCNSSYR